jgi:hypothetical protein
LVQVYCVHLLFGSSLALHSIAFAVSGLYLLVSGEGISHVLVSLVLFVDQVIGGRNVVVSVCLHAPHCIFLLEIVVFDEFRQKLLVPRHLLETGEQSWFARDLLHSYEICFHEGMTPDILNSESSLGVRIQNLGNEVFTLGRQKLRHLVVCAHYLLVEVGSLRILKGQVASHHCVENNPRGPNICLETIVAFSCYHFWRSIAGRATCRFERLTFFIEIGKTEINNPEGIVVVQQKILWFQVSVANPALVKVLDAGDELSVQLCGLLLSKSGVSNDEVEQLASVCIFHYHKELFVSFDNLYPVIVMILTSYS